MDSVKGRNAGTKRKAQDKKNGLYPRENQPEKTVDRSIEWVEAYKKSYYGQTCAGRPTIGRKKKVTISVVTDPDLVDEVLAAGLSRSNCFEVGAKKLLADMQNNR